MTKSRLLKLSDSSHNAARLADAASSQDHHEPVESLGQLLGAELIRSKFYIPQLHPTLVQRRRLLALLNLEPLPSLSVICAPAGFGKTTLLSEWAVQSPNPVAWVSLDGGDNDPLRFWSYIIAALETLRPGFGRQALDLLRLFDARNANSFMAAFINEIGTWAGALHLVLDDYHTIESPALRAAVAFLVEHMPVQMHLMIASRVLPDLPLTRLRARGQLTEMGVTELAFNRDETVEFFDRSRVPNLTREDVEAIFEKTEGWVTGLQLVAHSVRSRPDMIRSVTDLAGTQRSIADYLTEEVLRQQTPELQDFLLKTSILDRLSGPLCDAVLGYSDHRAQQILEQLEGANVLILSLDQERHWYRYHALFAELLLEKLNRAYPGEVLELYRRASEWYAHNGWADDAIAMAICARAFDLAADLIEDNYQHKARRSEVTTLGDWVRALPLDLVLSRPRLSLALAWSHLAPGHILEAEKALTAAESAALRDEATGAFSENARNVRGEVLAIRSIILTMQGRPENLLEVCAEADSLLSPDRHWLRGLVTSSLGGAYLMHGDVTEAHRLLTEAIESQSESCNLLVAYRWRYFLAIAEMKRGNLHRAAEILREELRMVKLDSGGYLPIASQSHITLGCLLCEWNELDAAESHLDLGMKLSEGWLVSGALNEGYLTLARLHRAQGKQAVARADAQLVAKRACVFCKTFLTHVSIAELRSWILAGLLKDEVANAESIASAPQASELFDYHRFRETNAAAHYMLALGNIDLADRLLEHLLSVSETSGRIGELLELLVLRVLACVAKGDLVSATMVLTRALRLAEPEGYVRIFVDEGQDIASLLERSDVRKVAPEYVGRLLAAFPRSERSEQNRNEQDRNDSVDSLSGREIEVLQLIASGLSTEQTAGQLVVTPGTVRNHLKSIHTKLGVHTRLQAVQRARELHII